MFLDTATVPAPSRLPFAACSEPPPPRAPHSPRVLTLGERRHLDLHVYHSPKLNRPVETTSALDCAAGMLLDFDPACRVYVERPRCLRGPDGEVELNFFVRGADGRERYLLLVPDTQTELAAPGSRRRVHRHARTLIEMAQASGLALEFCFEEDVAARGNEVMAAFRMLPYVRDARRLPQRTWLGTRVRELLSTHGPRSFFQIEHELAPTPSADVRAVVCDLVHAGVLAVETCAPFTPGNLVRVREGRHE